MGISVGELFVNLGVKGTEKTIGAITSIGRGLKDTASTSLEAKAAILGAAYAFERLIAASGSTGTSITNLSAFTGESMKALQQYQFAARQVGMSNEAMAATFTSVQSKMAALRFHGQAPEGLATVEKMVGFDVNKIEDTKYVLQKLREYALKDTDVQRRNRIMEGFGVGKDFIAGAARGGFAPETLAKAPTYGDKELSQLDKANIAWSNLATKVEMAFGHFNAAHGMGLVKDFQMLADAAIKFVNALVILSEKANVFEAIAKSVEAIASGMTTVAGLLGGTKTLTGENIDKKTGKVKGESDASKLWKSLSFGGDEFGFSENVDTRKKSISPKVSPVQKSGATNNVNIKQDLHFQHEGKDAKKTGDSAKKAVRDAYFLSPARNWGG